jgi:CBS domain-containing protein
MTGTIPFNTDSSPTVILELIFRLKIRDVMTRKLVVGKKSDTLRALQALMRENGITGVPIASGPRLQGLVTVDTIFRALEGGYIDETADKWMTRNTVVLEEDMPLSFGISSMDKYRFGRFPVLNRDRELVGIITSRDVLTSLLLEINKEVERLEGERPARPAPPAGSFFAEFPVHKYDFENAGKASSELKRALTERSVPTRLIRRAAIAAYELEMNLVLHSDGGRLTFDADDGRVEIVARDSGPGIADTKAAMEEGYSTASEWVRSLGFGAGMGLPNARRVSDEFGLQSAPGSGTEVRAVVALHEKSAEGGSDANR